MALVSGGGGGVTLNPLVAASATDTPVALKPPAGSTAAATDQLEVYDDAGNLIGYWDAAGNFLAESVDAAGYRVTLGATAARLDRRDGLYGLGIFSGNIAFFLLAGTVLDVFTHTGVKAFEIRDDGSVHIRTGTAVVADL